MRTTYGFPADSALGIMRATSTSATLLRRCVTGTWRKLETPTIWYSGGATRFGSWANPHDMFSVRFRPQLLIRSAKASDQEQTPWASRKLWEVASVGMWHLSGCLPIRQFLQDKSSRSLVNRSRFRLCDQIQCV